MSGPDCSDVCEAVHERLNQLGFRFSGDEDHTDILEALNKVEFILTDKEHKRAREIAQMTLAMIARDPDFRVVRHFMEYVCAALNITGKELIDASIAVAKSPGLGISSGED